MPNVCTDEHRVSTTGSAEGPVPKSPRRRCAHVLRTFASTASPGRSSTRNLAIAIQTTTPGLYLSTTSVLSCVSASGASRVMPGIRRLLGHGL